jgi:hypothetical protein
MSLLLALLSVAAGFPVAGAAATISSDRLYQIQTSALHPAKRFLIERRLLHRVNAAWQTPPCPQTGENTGQFPATDLNTLLAGYPDIPVLDRGAHYLSLTGLVQDNDPQVGHVGSRTAAAIHGEADFIGLDEGALRLPVSTAYFIGAGPDTMHCIADPDIR